MIYFTLIFSLIFEAIISNIVEIDSIFIPIFLLCSLVIIYPYIDKKNNFLILSIISGFFYDNIFVNSNFISTISFFICAYLIIMLYKILNNNFINSLIAVILTLILYRLSTYLLLILIGYNGITFKLLFRSIYSSLIINIIYSIILYFILKKINIIKKIGKNKI